MDPVIAGTLIGGRFASIGTAASIWATRRTLLANREMARDDRLWEKRSALYEQLLEQTTVIDSEHLDAIFHSLERLRTPAWSYASDGVLHQYWVTLQALQDVEQPREVADEARQVIVAMEETHRLARRVREHLQETRRPGLLWRLRHPRGFRKLYDRPRLRAGD